MVNETTTEVVDGETVTVTKKVPLTNVSIVAAGDKAGSGSEALKPVREKMSDPLKTKTITLTCAKLTTGVTVEPWSCIFMLSSISTPEAYFQSAFRVQSAWVIKSDDVDKPDIIEKPKCYIFDFAPDRALKSW